MSRLEQRIDQFENTYLEPLKVLARGVSPDDLDLLIESLDQMEQQSAEISGMIKREDDAALQARWRHILEQIHGRIPTVLAHVTELRDKVRKAIDGVAKGQRGIAGYQRATEQKQGHFERDA